MKRIFGTGNEAVTEGAILAGCRVFAGYPITPATELAENMSRRLPQVGGYYLQAEDELAALHICNGASLGGLKAMTATSGPGFILYADALGWALSAETPVVLLNSQRVGPVSGISGAPGQGEFYLSRYLAQGGNYESIVLAPNSVQEALTLTVEAFYLAERFRTPVTLLADQIVTDGWETIELPQDETEATAMGLHFWPRQVHPGPDFYPDSDAIDIPPAVLGRGTSAACSDWTPTTRGFDTEDITWHHKHAFRLIHKILSHRHLIDRAETYRTDDAPEIVLVSYGSVSRVIKSAVDAARLAGYKVGAIRPISLWPFQDALFARPAKYISVELNWDGQLVREVKRAAGAGSQIHFAGKCGELPSVRELLELIEAVANDRPLARRGWELEAW